MYQRAIIPNIHTKMKRCVIFVNILVFHGVGKYCDRNRLSLGVPSKPLTILTYRLSIEVSLSLDLRIPLF